MMKSGRLYLVYLLMPLIPQTRMFGFKRALFRWCGADVGENVRIVSSARFFLSGPLSLGRDTWIGHDVLIIGGNAKVSIGAQVDIAPRVTLVTGTHEAFTTAGRAAGRGYSSPISIEDGAWVGAATTILGGVTLGRCCIVAAASLVNRDVDKGQVVAGVPARSIKSKASREMGI